MLWDSGNKRLGLRFNESMQSVAMLGFTLGYATSLCKSYAVYSIEHSVSTEAVRRDVNGFWLAYVGRVLGYFREIILVTWVLITNLRLYFHRYIVSFFSFSFNLVCYFLNENTPRRALLSVAEQHASFTKFSD